VRCIGWIHNSFEALFSAASLYIGPQLEHHYVLQMQKLDCTVVLGRHDANEWENALQEYCKSCETHVTVIPNPLTLKPGHSSTGTSKRFLAVGRMSRLHKGFDLLIDAFRLFAQNDREWKLDIVGEGPEEERLREMIADYALEQRVTLHPFTNSIQDYYSQAQVYVLSSRWEGFGLVLVEAMAHGLPVVSSDLPTSLEIMGSFGLYFRNGNAEELAARLTDATRLDDWPAIQAEARHIARRFSTDRIVSQWLQTL
jgi:glycosyltransferase involved in cell wall biosynthesis